MECVSCAHDLDHCHGTLIEHPCEPAECTDLDCVDLDRARHLDVVGCDVIEGGCGCRESAVDPVAIAS